MKNLYKITLAAVFTALVCVSTMLIQIPMPLTNGYINLGDGFVLAAAWTIGAPWGVVAAGLGSALADLISGYAHYVPATFIIKSLMAIAALIVPMMFKCKGFSGIKNLAGNIAGAVAAEIVMVGGYFVYGIFLYGLAGSAGSVFGNVIQGVFGAAIGILIMTSLEKTGVLKKLGLKTA